MITRNPHRHAAGALRHGRAHRDKQAARLAKQVTYVKATLDLGFFAEMISLSDARKALSGWSSVRALSTVFLHGSESFGMDGTQHHLLLKVTGPRPALPTRVGEKLTTGLWSLEDARLTEGQIRRYDKGLA